MATARRLFAEQGYYDTGTNQIVSAAGVGTRGALYHHFPNKQALFLAVLEDVEEALATRAAVRLSGRSWLSKLRQGLDGFLDASMDAEVRRVLLIDGPAVLGWETWREVEARYGIGALRHMLDKGMREGSIKPVDSEAMAHLLLSAVDEAALFIAHSDEPREARAAAGGSLAVLLAGLASD